MIKRYTGGALVLGSGFDGFDSLEVRTALCRFTDMDLANERLYAGDGKSMDSLWAEGASAYVHTDGFYYDPDEGGALLASVGLAPGDLHISVLDVLLTGGDSLIKAASDCLSEQGIDVEYRVQDPASSTVDTTPRSMFGFSERGMGLQRWKYEFEGDRATSISWFRFCDQDLYAPELYSRMKEEYGAMLSAGSWEERVEHCRELTKAVQDDFSAIGGAERPQWLCADASVKNAVWFDGVLQVYYLYN